MTYTTIKLRRGTESEWSESNPILGLGEYGYETDTRKSKVGDGTTAWTDLAYTNSYFGTPTDVKFSGTNDLPATYQAQAGQIVPCDATFNNYTVRLPESPANGSTVTVKRIDSEPFNTVTVQGLGSDVFNYSGGPNSYVLLAPTQTVVLQYDSGIWLVISDSSEKSKLETVSGSAADRLIARMAVGPSDTRRELIKDLVSDLSACGVWDKLDALYVFAAHTAQAARLNWKSSVLPDASSVNSPAFEVDRGFTGDGGSSYLDTTVYPSDYVQYQDDDATLGVYVRTSVSLNVNDIAMSPYSGIATAAGNNIVVRINSSSFVNGSNGGDRTGLFAASRLTGANTAYVYKDGVSAGSGAQSAPLLANTPAQFLRSGLDSYSTRQLAAGFIGGGLTAQQHADLNTALTIYLTAIGAAV
jgi:hypothetical protein